MPPARPQVSAAPSGYDYLRFRSYWERIVLYRLRSCGQPHVWPLSLSGPVWDEERLVLIRWKARPMGSGSGGGAPTTHD